MSVRCVQFITNDIESFFEYARDNPNTMRNTAIAVQVAGLIYLITASMGIGFSIILLGYLIQVAPHIDPSDEWTAFYLFLTATNVTHVALQLFFNPHPF